MSQGMVGADIEQLQTLGVTLQAQAEEVRSIADLINRYLPGAPWTGYKADVFRQQWWPQHQAQLRSIADGLHGLGQSALKNADEQRRTSDVRGFAGSAGAGGDGPLGESAPWFRFGGFPWGISETGLELASGALGGVVGSFRAGGGAWKSGFGWMWNESTGQGIRASFASGVLDKVFVAGAVAVAGVEGWGAMKVQEIRDVGDASLDGAESTGRQFGAFGAGAGASGLISAGGIAAGGVVGGALAGSTAAVIGGAIGTAIPVPVVGTAIGIAVGVGVSVAGTAILNSSVGSLTIREHIGELGADAGDAVVDGYRGLVGGVGDGLELAGGVAQSVDDAVDRLWPF